LNDEISTVNPRKFERKEKKRKEKKRKEKKKKRKKKKKGWTDIMYPPKYIFFFAPLAKGLLT